jgi:hypothetical protein
MPDFTTIIGYLSGIYLIDPKLEPSSLLPTLIAVQFLDGILCLIIARHSGRRAALWGLVGLIAGVLAVLPLLLLPGKNRDQGSGIRGQGSGIRGQQSGGSGQGTGVRDPE